MVQVIVNGQMVDMPQAEFNAATANVLPSPPIFPTVTYKTDIWSRCSEEEAEMLDGQLSTASVKDRRIWDDCQAVDHSSPMFANLKTAMALVFGETTFATPGSGEWIPGSGRNHALSSTEGAGSSQNMPPAASRHRQQDYLRRGLVLTVSLAAPAARRPREAIRPREELTK